MTRATALALICAIVGITVLPPSAASAENLTIAITNNSNQAINSITATSKLAALASTTNVYSGDQITIAHEPDDCIFNLKITYADGVVMDRNDIDLCQADSVVVE